MKSFIIGFVMGAFMFMAPASAIKSIIKQMQSELDELATGTPCRTATVEDIDLWDRSMLISVNTFRFIMSAVDRNIYEICLVDEKVQTLDEARKMP